MYIAKGADCCKYLCQIIHVRTYLFYAFHVQYRSMCGMKDSPAVKVVIACLNIFLYRNMCSFATGIFPYTRTYLESKESHSWPGCKVSYVACFLQEIHEFMYITLYTYVCIFNCSKYIPEIGQYWLKSTQIARKYVRVNVYSLFWMRLWLSPSPVLATFRLLRVLYLKLESIHCQNFTLRKLNTWGVRYIRRTHFVSV